MKRKNLLVCACAIVLASGVSAQDTASFVPNGKVSARIFSNYSTQFTSEDVNSVGFNLERAYFGYAYAISKELSAEVKLDVGSPTDVSSGTLKKRVAYVRNAYGTYKLDASTKLSFGLVDIMTCKLQEDFWGYRYVYKTFQDEHKLGQKTDLGIILKHSVSEQLDFDIAVTNGEGYGSVQTDLDFLYGFGATIKPTSEFLIRVYGDYSSLSNTPINLNSLLSITPNDKISWNAEYVYSFNNKNLENHDLSGFSLYTTYKIDEQVSVFARFDKLWSNVLSDEFDPWNESKDGNAVIGGFEYIPTKNLRVSLNYAGWIYDNSSYETKNRIGIYTEIKF